MGEGEGHDSEGWKAGALSRRSASDRGCSEGAMGEVQGSEKALIEDISLHFTQSPPNKTLPKEATLGQCSPRFPLDQGVWYTSGAMMKAPIVGACSDGNHAN